LVDFAFGPDEWARFLIIAGDEVIDMFFELIDRLEGSAG
jgi:hypothetical protein